jgi:uncharacterized protein YdaU (DUF1376 family)
VSQPPLVASEVDLRDFPYMPLDVVRVRDSDLATHASPEEFRCAVLLWCASWHQLPAGSLPNDDAVLAKLAGFGRSKKEWMKHRAGALHNWIMCDDGRFYHPTVAEKATEAWEAKCRQRLRTEAARIARQSHRARASVTDKKNTNVSTVTESKGREGKYTSARETDAEREPTSAGQQRGGNPWRELGQSLTLVAKAP